MQKRLWTLLAVVVIVGGAALVAYTLSARDEGGSDQAAPENVVADAEANAAEEVAPGEYRTLSIDEFAEIVENKADEYLIINVHIPYAGEVQNTDANIPFNDLDALMAAIPSKDTPVVVYCRSGSMSSQAARALAAQGYTQIWDVPGGMAAWQASGRTLIDR